jgi:hypothetical protein
MLSVCGEGTFCISVRETEKGQPGESLTASWNICRDEDDPMTSTEPHGERARVRGACKKRGANNTNKVSVMYVRE